MTRSAMITNDGKYTMTLTLNGDNKLDVETGEIGAALLVNSWGSSWGNNGKAWIMYKVLADTSTNGGIYYNSLRYKLYEDTIIKPNLTFKFSLAHPNKFHKNKEDYSVT